ncbi:MAG TPA: hypothetical protein VGY56_09920 [Verrucomicrobiae bacterium]|nr:hypothetical protein [Verrucomicrobiae bacterium]
MTEPAVQFRPSPSVPLIQKEQFGDKKPDGWSGVGLPLLMVITGITQKHEDEAKGMVFREI